MGNPGGLVHERIDRDVKLRYLVDRRIGRGCYGVVYEAKEIEGFKRYVAIKKVLYAFRNATDAQRTYREVSYLIELCGHENILRIYDVICSRDDKHLYIITELLDADLQKTIKSMKLEETQRKFITYQLLRALKYLHSAGVIHRDVKPANVLVSRLCEAKLADFGWARSATAALGVEDPMTEYAATRWYRSPEMILGASRYTSAVDLWSVGCVSGEMKLRAPVVGGSSTITMLNAIVDMLGKPSADDIASMQAQFANYMLECLVAEPPRYPIEKKFQGESAECIDFLQLLLQVNPGKRMTANEALQHPYVGNFHNPDNEPVFGRRIALVIPDSVKAPAARYRDQVYADMLGFESSRRRVNDVRRKQLAEEALMERSSLV